MAGGCKEITGGIEYPAQLIEVLVQLALRRGGRVAEGAALEMPYTGNCIAGSNPALSAKQSGHLRTSLRCPENVAMFRDIERV